MDWIQKARRWLATPVDAASLVWVRVALGVGVAWEMGRYLTNGWVSKYWLEPEVLFTYWPFTFVQPWPADWMQYAHVLLVAVAAIGVAIGWRYRLCSIVMFLAFTWLFLLDQTRYLNHLYLLCLLCFMLTWLPVDREASVDAWAGRVERSPTVPRWALFWARFMVGAPYVFGGIAKIQPDWMTGLPMRAWLDGGMGLPGVGDWLLSKPSVLFFTWGGLLFDLLVVPLMLWPRTRVLGLGLNLTFHLLNSRLLKIGVFPWMMILLTLIFLPPDWPKRVWDDVRQGRRPAIALAIGAILGFGIGSVFPSQPSAMNAVIAAIGVGVFFWEVASYGWDWKREPEQHPQPVQGVSATGFALGTAFALFQILVPLRHMVIPGEVNWTEEGHRWAWHMKLRYKSVDEFYFLLDPPGEAEPLRVNPRKLLERHQYEKVAQTPVLTVMLAHELAKRSGIPGVAVYVRSQVSLNGRPAQPLIDPDMDLTQVKLPIVPPAPWIVPLRGEIPPLPGLEPSRVSTRGEQ